MQETSPLESAAVDAKTAVAWAVAEALRRRASDLHLEPTAEGCELRLRIDGLLQTERTLSPSEGRAYVSRLMVMAKLLTYRQDVPQEGRCRAAVEVDAQRREVDLRVSVMPTNHGLRAAVRLPAELLQPQTLDQLGLPRAVLHQLTGFASADAGMLLLTGPAGSGKTTTIYALLDKIRQTHPGLSMVALEDPIERDLPGVTQIEVTPFGELTYERALRSILRQDPQVLALGEIRDAATARVAVQAALSGHRLISTLHAASPAGAMLRLVEMGLEPYQVAGALWGVASLRLLRRSDGRGGYAGRLPVANLARLTEPVRAALLAGRPLPELTSAVAEQPAYAPLHAVGRQWMEQGLTDEAEVRRVLGGDETMGGAAASSG
jgi:type II secretory ATPase GspE/PulE/Tfp pilus assembly ATPase PilB-like protein